MNRKPLVSVILPFYNAANTLADALASIENQSYDNFECVMVNNNSSDDGANVAKIFCEKDTRFRLVEEKTQGVMFASNKGSNEAKGELICRMDADDVMAPDRLKWQVAFLLNNSDYGAVAGLVKYVPHKEDTDGFARYVDWVNSVQSYDEIMLNRFVESPIVNPTAMWRSEVAQQWGMYRQGDFPEDYEQWLRWLENGVKIAKVPKEVLEWNDSDGRLTRTDDIYSDEAFYRIKTEYLSRFLAKKNSHHPSVFVWGGSKISRRRALMLEEFGIDIKAYIDINKNRQLDKEVIFFEDIPESDSCFVLVYFKHNEKRKEIKAFLEKKGFTEGDNFLLLS
ncbi:glycosyltransferase family 2 protein [Prolixibacteraceae bacterium JC049]|nr:glycosyltransferase family 2 protein [Prolixibacteraceae bacterium JC049]